MLPVWDVISAGGKLLSDSNEKTNSTSTLTNE